MSKALVISIGSRGDTEPLISLSTTLLTHFESVHIVHQPDYTSLISNNHRITSYELPFKAADFRPVFLREKLKSLLLSVFTGFDTIKIQTRCLTKFISDLIVPTLPWLFELAEQVQPDVVLATTLGYSVAESVAEKLGVPLCLIHFQPNTPTGMYPCYMHGTDNALLAGAEVAKMHEKSPMSERNEDYLETYDTQYDLFIPSLPDLNRHRVAVGVKPMEVADIKDMISGKSSKVHVINSFCKQLVLPSPDHSANVHIVPPLADAFIPQNWIPEKACPGVVEYLSAGGKPVCVTFGSTGGNVSSVTVTRELLSGLRAANVNRVLVLNHTTDLGIHNLWKFRDGDLITWAKEHVFVTTEQPQYAWLMPRCKALICHGGAGTTFAALRAGIPVVVSPVLCDQFFWGRLVEQLGIGAVAGPILGRATRDAFQAGVERVLSTEVMERVRSFGEREREGRDGVSVAAEIVTELISTC